MKTLKRIITTAARVALMEAALKRYNDDYKMRIVCEILNQEYNPF